MKASDFEPLTPEEREQMYDHVIYEFESVLDLPNYHDDGRLKECVYLKALISFRLLDDFFSFDESKNYKPDDVFAWQFFEEGTVQRDFRGKEHVETQCNRNRINKQIAHLSKMRRDSRLCDSSKAWKMGNLNKIRPRIVAFCQAILSEREGELSQETQAQFMHLLELARKSYGVSKDALCGETSNVSVTIASVSVQPAS
ncbi:hypothetical protein QEH59_15575 [Coraliomargarita sp. SDUM461004]|uniref:Uncharacterized protein n=1 Tax=Thalassobacterium sedimentorum TaxID=3041258 RepID=A0ABU1AM42_9BACT|nr:hypothetical protein [Coraliomargarita sp. SDUM461004]MDQ8195853.1 hypothetical protein [Coraliomargarita sp. SDUM461004]